MKIVWFPAWLCQNYTLGESYGKKCPYCPYSLNKNTNRLIYNNQETSSDERANPEDLIAFFMTNYEAMGGLLEVSGGEALMRRDLPAILATIPHRWGMTSNTLFSKGIDEIIEFGAIERCASWTASWHPCSGQEDSFSRNIKMLASAGRTARATVVISEDTIGRLSDALQFLKGLPLAGINWHLDAHKNQDSSAFLKAAADEILGPDIAYLAGKPKQGVMCRRHENLMAVGPDGTLYQCVTFAYQNKYPICKVSGDILVSSLEKKTEWCDDECFACCDWIKHAAQV